MASCYHNTWKMGRISVASIREVNTAVFFVDVDLFVFFFLVEGRGWDRFSLHKP